MNDHLIRYMLKLYAFISRDVAEVPFLFISAICGRCGAVGVSTARRFFAAAPAGRKCPIGAICRSDGREENI